MLTYGPADVAEKYGCKVEKVLVWIASRDLIAINVATNPNGGKPRWRITPEALEDFERARSTRPAPKPIPRTRRTLPPVKKYF